MDKDCFSDRRIGTFTDGFGGGGAGEVAKTALGLKTGDEIVLKRCMP